MVKGFVERRLSKLAGLQINTWNVFDAAVPFGGYKLSGIGREHGEEALHHYTQVGPALPL